VYGVATHTHQIKDAAEKRRMDDRQLQALLAGGSPMYVVLQPDLVYDYNNKCVRRHMLRRGCVRAG
jgi:hypothetical protein